MIKFLGFNPLVSAWVKRGLVLNSVLLNIRLQLSFVFILIQLINFWQVFWICISLLEMAYLVAILVGASSSFLWSKYITVSYSLNFHLSHGGN